MAAIVGLPRLLSSMVFPLSLTIARISFESAA
jgi:hypothetical protein